MVKKVDKIDKDKLNMSEMEKCKNDPRYFYNTYATINGKPVEPLSVEEWNNRINEIEYLRNKSPLKFRMQYKDYPLLLKDVK